MLLLCGSSEEAFAFDDHVSAILDCSFQMHLVPDLPYPPPSRKLQHWHLHLQNGTIGSQHPGGVDRY